MEGPRPGAMEDERRYTMTEAPPPPPETTPTAPAAAPQGNGVATAGMVLGIIALATSWMFCAPYVPLVCGIVGLILGVVGSGKAKQLGGAGAGKAKVGIILSIIGVVIIVVILILVATVFAEVTKSLTDEIRKAQEMYNNQTP